MKATMELAQILGMDTAALQADYEAKRTAAEMLWNGEFYVSGEGKQVSWASQVWMTLGGAKHGGAELLKRLENTQAEAIVTPYMYHTIKIQQSKDRPPGGWSLLFWWTG